MTASPIAYSPELEQREADEEETSAGLRDALREILETTSSEDQHAPRSVHAKAHALVEGTMTIAPGLPSELAQGLFATPGEHRVVMRFSTSPGDILDDSVTTPRGVAIKVLDVAGARDNDDETATQDFVLVDGPAFGAPKLKIFLANLKLLAKTTNRAEGAKKILSGALRAVETALEAVGSESALLKTLGGARSLHPLGQRYFSQTAFRYGDHVAKFSLVPISPGLTALDGETVHVVGRPEALREACAETFVEAPAEWSFRVQLCTDVEEMPIENPAVVWDEEQSPFVEVARVRVAPQPSWVRGATDRAEDALSFSPWHCLAAHRPLGAINRARKEAYRMSSAFRGDFNRCPMHEPRPDEPLLPDGPGLTLTRS